MSRIRNVGREGIHTDQEWFDLQDKQLLPYSTQPHLEPAWYERIVQWKQINLTYKVEICRGTDCYARSACARRRSLPFAVSREDVAKSLGVTLGERYAPVFADYPAELKDHPPKYLRAFKKKFIDSHPWLASWLVNPQAPPNIENKLVSSKLLAEPDMEYDFPFLKF